MNGAELGATIDLDLPEFGAKDPAKVVSIKPCPPIKSGPGNVVTGKFIHESDGNLINLRIKDQHEPTTVTSNHRYWSADRNEFVEAGHLKPGEQVSTLAGLKQVVSIIPRAGNEIVDNLEVQGEHVYLVGSLGTIVHNTCASFSGKIRNFTVKHSSRKKALEAARHRTGKPKPTPPKSNKRKRKIYDEQQKYKNPEAHNDTKHPGVHLHDSLKEILISRHGLNPHQIFPRIGK